MKKLLAVIVVCASTLTAYAQSPKSTVISNINGDFADNATGAITAALLRSITTEIVSSYVDWITCATSPTAGSLIYYVNGGTPTCLPFGSSGQVLRAGDVSPSWQNLVTALISGTGITISGTVTPTIGLTNQISAAGPIGSATIVPSVTFNAQGQLTTVTSNTISASTLLDVIGNTQGDLLYRASGGTGWAVITPGVSGQVLTTGGAGNNPSFTSVAGTGTLTSITCSAGITCNPNPITASGTITPTVASTAQFQAGTAAVLLDANVVFTPETVISQTVLQTIDFSTFISAGITLTENTSTTTCTNIKTGQAGQIAYHQDTTGSRTTTFCSQFRFPNATTPTLTTSATAYDILVYGPCRTTAWCAASLLKGFNP